MQQYTFRGKKERPYRVERLIDGPVAELYFDGKVALSARMNELRGGYFGFLCEYGEIRIDNLKVEIVSGQCEQVKRVRRSADGNCVPPLPG